MSHILPPVLGKPKCLALKPQQHWPAPPVQMEDSHKFVPFPTEPWAATPLITIGAPLDAGLHIKMQQNQRAPERGRAEPCYLHQTQNDEPKDKLEPRKHHCFLKNYSGRFSSCQYKLLVYTPITNCNKIKTKPNLLENQPSKFSSLCADLY